MAHTQSIWLTGAQAPQFPKLESDAETDVCVVGAGIAGMTTAYLLGRAGRRVLVLDDGRMGHGETRTQHSAHHRCTGRSLLPYPADARD